MKRREHLLGLLERGVPGRMGTSAGGPLGGRVRGNKGPLLCSWAVDSKQPAVRAIGPRRPRTSDRQRSQQPVGGLESGS